MNYFLFFSWLEQHLEAVPTIGAKVRPTLQKTYNGVTPSSETTKKIGLLATMFIFFMKRKKLGGRLYNL